jgi:hypothetical protein
MCNKDECAFVGKPLCGRMTDAAIATDTGRGFSFELAAVFSSCVSYGFIARGDAQRAVGFIRLGCSFII